MDKKLKNFQIILEYVEAHKEWASRDKTVEYYLIADKENGHIQLFRTYFNKDNIFQFLVIFHFQIKEDGKVWVLVNNTEIELGIEFMKKGISNKEIVIGFLPPKYRQYSDYAIA